MLSLQDFTFYCSSLLGSLVGFGRQDKAPLTSAPMPANRKNALSAFTKKGM